MILDNSKSLEYINCPICNKNNKEIYKQFIIDKETYTLVKCDCSLVYLNPRPNLNNISKYYESDYLPHNNIKLNKFLKFIQNFLFTWKKYIINKHTHKIGTILDYGSGDGLFADFMKKNQWSVNKYDVFYNNINFEKNKYDAITMWHSLEHMHLLDDVFSKLKNNISENGKIFIALPNLNSIDKKIFQDNWVAYDLPRHLYHFNTKSFKNLIKKNNIKIINSYSIYQDTIFNVFLSLNCHYVLKILITPIICVFFFVLILFNKNLSSSILYVCQKK